MSDITNNLMQQVLTALFNAWILDAHISNIQDVNRVKNVMQAHKVTFIERRYSAEEVFFNRVTLAKYDNYEHFCWLCDQFMNFDVVVSKISNEVYEAEYEMRYGAIALAEHKEGVTLISPIK